MDLKVALFSLIPIILVSILLFKPKHKNLPPGPRCWPLIGNVAVLFNDPLTTVTNMGRTYGPIMTIWFGNKPTVIASTEEAAMEILNTNDRVCSGRCVPVPFRLKHHIKYSLVWSNCNEYWKLLRKIARTEIFSPKMLQVHSHVREEKVGELVEYLRSKEGEAVKLTQFLAGTLLNILGNAVFSRDVFVYSDDDDGIANKDGFRDRIREMFEIGSEPSIADFFPIFEELDLHGLKRKVNERFLRIIQLWEVIVNERRQKRNEETKDMLDVLLAHDFNDDQINAFFLDTFGPGSETTSTSIEWVLAALIKNPNEMAKVRKELDGVVGTSTMKDSHLPQLPYLQACIKEALRLYPASPMLIPRQNIEACEVMGYTIPKDCQILVNVYAIGIDPNSWTDPLTFRPERFLESDMNYNGGHYQFIPFGSGRRVCVAIPLATRIIPLIVGSLVHKYDWGLPDGKRPEELEMKQKLRMSLAIDPTLYVVPKMRA